MLKDLTLAADAAKAADQPTMLAAVAQQLYQMHVSHGNGDLDFSSILKVYADDSRGGRQGTPVSHST